MNLSEIVHLYMLRGFTRPIAQNLAAEDVILTKIPKTNGWTSRFRTRPKRLSAFWSFFDARKHAIRYRAGSSPQNHWTSRD